MKHLNIIRFIIMFLLCIFVLLPVITLADTNITSNVTKNTVWDISGSPYIITGEIHVFQNVILTIASGVEVKFNQDAELIIGGQLIAVGTIDDPITFTSNSSTPSRGVWKGISFANTAITATYQANFEYDYNNYQILLNYLSGSIIEYCIIEFADMGVKSSEVYPAIKNNNIRNCNTAMYIDNPQPGDYDPTSGIEKWLFFYGNTIEQCETGLEMTTRGNDHAVISNNTFRENELGILSPGYNISNDHAWSSGMIIFNNQFINNTEIAIMIDRYDTYQSPPFVFLYNNNITFNGKGVQVLGHLVALHNYVYNNRLFSYLYVFERYPNGAAFDLSGPVAYLFNNTIQQNGIDTGGHGDGIFLQTSDFNWGDTLNEFVIKYNNLGNSVWDQFDIYIEPDADCSWSKELEVDATNNYWQTSNPSDTIHDSSDVLCAGTVHFEPTAGSAMIPSPLKAHPTLISPENYSEVEQTNYSGGGTRSSYTISFSWSSVLTATKYLLCTYGYEYLDNSANNVVEVTTGTSGSITSYIDGTVNDHFVHWFVVAGNENGWGLPSEVRHVRIVEPSDHNDDVSQNNSSGGSGSGGGGCFIATAAYGSSMAPHVKILREYRDRFLFHNKVGDLFVKLYYIYSPPIAEFIAKHANVRLIVRVSLLPLVGMSWVALNYGHVFILMILLLFGICLMGFMVFRKKFNK